LLLLDWDPCTARLIRGFKRGKEQNSVTKRLCNVGARFVRWKSEASRVFSSKEPAAAMFCQASLNSRQIFEQKASAVATALICCCYVLFGALQVPRGASFSARLKIRKSVEESGGLQKVSSEGSQLAVEN
jgi:hypothetical protein